MSEKEVAITVKGIPLECKENFTTFCEMNGMTLSEGIKRMICAVPSYSEDLKRNVKAQFINGFTNSHPDIIDKFISNREPMFSLIVDSYSRDCFRFQFVNTNPTYIYKEIQKWLDEENLSDL